MSDARKRLAKAVQATTDDPHGGKVTLSLADARAILEALQEADRREMQNTLDGDMP